MREVNINRHVVNAVMTRQDPLIPFFHKDKKEFNQIYPGIMSLNLQNDTDIDDLLKKFDNMLPNPSKVQVVSDLSQLGYDYMIHAIQQTLLNYRKEHKDVAWDKMGKILFDPVLSKVGTLTMPRIKKEEQEKVVDTLFRKLSEGFGSAKIDASMHEVFVKKKGKPTTTIVKDPEIYMKDTLRNMNTIYELALTIYERQNEKKASVFQVAKYFNDLGKSKKVDDATLKTIAQRMGAVLDVYYKITKANKTDIDSLSKAIDELYEVDRVFFRGLEPTMKKNISKLTGKASKDLSSFDRKSVGGWLNALSGILYESERVHTEQLVMNQLEAMIKKFEGDYPKIIEAAIEDTFVKQTGGMKTKEGKSIKMDIFVNFARDFGKNLKKRLDVYSEKNKKTITTKSRKDKDLLQRHIESYNEFTKKLLEESKKQQRLDKNITDLIGVATQSFKPRGYSLKTTKLLKGDSVHIHSEVKLDSFLKDVVDDGVVDNMMKAKYLFYNELTFEGQSVVSRFGNTFPSDKDVNLIIKSHLIKNLEKKYIGDTVDILATADTAVPKSLLLLLLKYGVVQGIRSLNDTSIDIYLKNLRSILDSYGVFDVQNKIVQSYKTSGAEILNNYYLSQGITDTSSHIEFYNKTYDYLYNHLFKNTLMSATQSTSKQIEALVEFSGVPTTDSIVDKVIKMRKIGKVPQFHKKALDEFDSATAEVIIKSSKKKK